MSGNKLLTENTVRRFMKLANVNSLTDSFINEKYTKEDEVQEEAVEETEETIEEEATEEETIEEQMEEEEPGMDMEEEEGEEDADADMEMDMDAEEPADEMGAADISLTEEEAQLLIDLGERLKEAMGDDAPAMDMDAEEPAMDMDAEEPEMDMEEEDEEEAPGGRMGMYENQDEIVQEVLRRVTKRIVAEKLKNAK